MSRTRPAETARGGRGPAPTEAGTNLLAHELKNLASRLTLLCGNLAANFEDPLFRQSAVGLLNDTAGYLKQIAVDLRDRDGRMIVKLPILLDEVLHAAVKDRLPDFGPGITLLQEYEAVDSIYGDAFLLRRAFACAIENALEALGGTGTVRVSCTQTRGRRPRIRVEIGDNGPGMSDEFVRQVLFRPFATTKDEGLGLGVYTIRQVATFHGARVKISSVEGQGTTVRFSFPAGELA